MGSAASTFNSKSNALGKFCHDDKVSGFYTMFVCLNISSVKTDLKSAELECALHAFVGCLIVIFITYFFIS